MIACTIPLWKSVLAGVWAALTYCAGTWIGIRIGRGQK